MNRDYSLYLERNGEKILLMKDSLINIDEITTSFKNKEKMVEILFRDKNYDYSNFKIVIESPNKHSVSFVGSDFRNVIKDFKDSININSLCEIDPNILLKYFVETLDESIMSTSRDQCEFHEKKDEYMNNNNIPIVQIINGLTRMIDIEDSLTRGERNSNNNLNIKINLKHNIRRYLEKYKHYRKMYCYMVGMSIIDNGEPSYNREERVRLKQFLDSASEKINNLIYGESQLTLNLELEEPVKKDVDEDTEDDDVVLDYIERKSSEDDDKTKKLISN